MKILFFGDIVGKPGRKAIAAVLPQLRTELQPNVVMANIENAAHGKGITKSTLQDLIAAGIDIGTGGNHSFSKPEAREIYANEPNIVTRPINFPNETVGSGQKMFEVSGKKVYVINLLGEYGMHIDRLENPFSVMGRLLNKGLPTADAIIVDFHAETTSEKVVMGWYLDGKVSAVLGTHTHVPTADTRLLAKGTAFVTDVGMVGLRDSSLGVDKDLALQRFLTGTNVAFEIPEHGIVAVNAVLMTFTDGRAISMERIYREVTV